MFASCFVDLGFSLAFGGFDFAMFVLGVFDLGFDLLVYVGCFRFACLRDFGVCCGLFVLCVLVISWFIALYWLLLYL